MRKHTWLLMLLAGSVPALAADIPPQTRPPGDALSNKTRVLKAGAAVLQSDNPLEPMNVYLHGFHAMKEDPSHQMDAHHFCSQVNEDFAQCVLFDGNTRAANLNGIEFIISEKLFNGLPADEKQYWHPHNYEILSGQLVAPGLPDVAEKALMKSKINSYGKTWHVWKTGAMGEKGDALPLGPSLLAWSFNRDGEARPGLVEQRDKAMGVDSVEKRRARAELIPFARPQSGVDALHGKFQRPTWPIAGVKDSSEGVAAPPAPETTGR